MKGIDKVINKHEVAYKTDDTKWSSEMPEYVPRIKFVLASPSATIPRASRPGDVGFDVFASREQIVPARGTLLVHTDVLLASMPTKIGATSVYLQVEGRSGLSRKGIFPVGGVIDPTYRGEIGVVLTNNSDTDYHILAGDRIAQLVVHSILTAGEVIFEETKEVEASNRGAAGFGSSGR